MRALLLLALISATTTFGCSSKSENAAAEAVKATDEAVKATDEASKLHREADDKATEAEAARREAEAKTNAAKGATDAAAETAHDEARDKLQKNFDAADRRFNGLKETAAKSTGDKKARSDAASAEVTTREASVMAGLAKLHTAVGLEWDTTKTQVEADLAALDKAIFALETALK